jgi:hypothetical protein
VTEGLLEDRRAASHRLVVVPIGRVVGAHRADGKVEAHRTVVGVLTVVAMASTVARDRRTN